MKKKIETALNEKWTCNVCLVVCELARALEAYIFAQCTPCHWVTTTLRSLKQLIVILLMQICCLIKCFQRILRCNTQPIPNIYQISSLLPTKWQTPNYSRTSIKNKNEMLLINVYKWGSVPSLGVQRNGRGPE